MKTQKINIFIVDENKSASAELKEHLQNRFGASITVSTFTDGKSCLEEVESDTHIVILNSSPKDNNGVNLLKAIKAANHETEVIMLAEHADITLAIESYQAGAKNLVVHGVDSRNKITSLVTRIVMAPIKIIEKELGLSQRLAMFLMSFITIGVIVWIYFIIKH
jgi:two-component system, NtrC family, response regulator AtoC